MLYSIIPPIILVLALIGIIVMLMKKSSQVALIKGEERMEENRNGASKESFWRRFSSKKKEESVVGVKHKLLIFLEKIVKKFRIFVLKLENIFHSWGETIRKKRKETGEAKESELPEEEKEKHLMEKIREYKPGWSNEKFKRNIAVKRDTILDLEEREVKPIISEKVVVPTPRSEIKDQLEKLLIERIAANPKDVEAYERLGEYYFEIKSYEYAKECFKQIIKLNPGNVGVKNKMRKLERLLMK